VIEMIKDIHEVTACVECGSTNIIYKDSENQILCRDCGALFEPLAPEDEEKLEKAKE
jgi:transcription initiation factor TFIIIB Brf1 subunit/transcription initiation factor TFIIB